MQTGLAMLVIGIDTVLAPTLRPRLVSRFGNTRLLFGGIVVAAVAYALFLPVGMDWTYAAMLPALLLLSLAFSLSYGPLTMAATEGIDEGEHGMAGGLLARWAGSPRTGHRSRPRIWPATRTPRSPTGRHGRTR